MAARRSTFTSGSKVNSGNFSRSAVIVEIGLYQPCGCSIVERTNALLLATLTRVHPLCALEKHRDFTRGNKLGIAFAAAERAAGAQIAREMIVDAWLDSANTPVGYSMVNVECGQAFTSLRGRGVVAYKLQPNDARSSSISLCGARADGVRLWAGSGPLNPIVPHFLRRVRPSARSCLQCPASGLSP